MRAAIRCRTRPTWSLSSATKQRAIARRNRESKPEQGDVDRQSRSGSRGALDVGRQPRGDVFARHQPFVELRVRGEAGKDGVAPLRGLELESVHARRYRRAL